MTRTSRYKIGYAAALASLVALALVILRLAQWRRPVFVSLAVAFLVPGRIQGVLFRDLFRGRWELDQQNPSAALVYLERFVSTVRSQRWRKYAIWLSASIYTPDVEAMALNNIGSAYLALDDNDGAETAWHNALELDSLYPLPYANLAILAAARGDSSAVADLVGTAKNLGYEGSALDRTIHRTQSLLARFESHGLSA